MLIRWKSKDKVQNKCSVDNDIMTKKKKKFKRDDKKTDGSGHQMESEMGKIPQMRINYIGKNEHHLVDPCGRRQTDIHQVSLLHTQSFTEPIFSGSNRSLNVPRHYPELFSLNNLSQKNASNSEIAMKSRYKKSYISKEYQSPLHYLDDDPGIMSEVETSSTGFRRGGKQRNSLPVVRTPSKTLERPLGLVFLQFRNETKRALLPNEITSIDTVKALFVRSFSKQLTMEYLDTPQVKIYIHDSNKDMFYELEDLRSHLRDIKDRSVLRLFEGDKSNDVPKNLGMEFGSMLNCQWEDQNYFSEPEFESEFQNQSNNKTKNQKNLLTRRKYHTSFDDAFSQSTIHNSNMKILTRHVSDPKISDDMKKNNNVDKNNLAKPPVPTDMTKKNIPSLAATSKYSSGSFSIYNSYEEPYYAHFAGSATPVVDEEARVRVEYMERQLASLTGLVQKALTHTPVPNSVPPEQKKLSLGVDHLSRDKSVSFEKSVSFSDEPPESNTPKQYSPQYPPVDTKPTKPAIKSSTLPRCGSQEKENKPSLPPKPTVFLPNKYNHRNLILTPEMYNHLRDLQKKTTELSQEIKKLRRLSQVQAQSMRETIRNTFSTLRSTLLANRDQLLMTGNIKKFRLCQEEDSYKEEMSWLEKDLTSLEYTVEELRSNVINKKSRVNMADVENMALILSKASKTVADLKVRFPNLQTGIKVYLSSKMEELILEEKFLKDEPERLESALRRCKKLTGTLVTLKRLASVQEQRLPNLVNNESTDASSGMYILEAQSKYEWMKSKNFKEAVHTSQE